MLEILSHIPPIPQPYADPYTLKPHEFIYTMFGNVPDGWIEVTYLAPEGIELRPRTKIVWAELPLHELDPELPHIHAMNAQGYGVYYGVAVRSQKRGIEERTRKDGTKYMTEARGKATDARYVTALWVDCDEPGDDGRRKILQAITAQPSIIVSSGRGWHAYWLLTEPLLITDENRAMVKHTLRGMALAAETDTSVADLARILRLPGTINTKPGRGTLCEVYDYIPARYHYTEFELEFAPLDMPKVPVITRQLPVQATAGMPRWVEDYLNTPMAANSGRNKRAYAAARALLDNGFSVLDVERIIGNKALSDGLPADEVETLLNSAARAPRGTVNIPRMIGSRMAAADRLIDQRRRF